MSSSAIKTINAIAVTTIYINPKVMIQWRKEGGVDMSKHKTLVLENKRATRSFLHLFGSAIKLQLCTCLVYLVLGLYHLCCSPPFNILQGNRKMMSSHHNSLCSAGDTHYVDKQLCSETQLLLAFTSIGCFGCCKVWAATCKGWQACKASNKWDYASQ